MSNGLPCDECDDRDMRERRNQQGRELVAQMNARQGKQ